MVSHIKISFYIYYLKSTCKYSKVNQGHFLNQIKSFFRKKCQNTWVSLVSNSIGSTSSSGGGEGDFSTSSVWTDTALTVIFLDGGLHFFFWVSSAASSMVSGFFCNFFVANHTPNLCKDEWKKKREKHCKLMQKIVKKFWSFTCSSVSVAALAMVSWVVLSVKALKHVDWLREM